MKLKLLLFALALIILSSCSSKRNLVYFSDLTDSSAYNTKILNLAETKIQSGDVLGITVNSLSPESNTLFNAGVMPAPPTDAPVSAPQVNNSPTVRGYEVDKQGFINFPVIGKVQVAGLTKNAVSDKLYNALKDYVKSPVVNVNFLNFRVTVIGEVNKPSTFILQNDRISVLEALGLAGDMTIYGKRENVLLIRQSGENRTMVRLNLNSKNVLNSPYFYLQQNDVVYVEPDRMREVQASTNTRTIAIVLASVSILTLIISRFF